MLSSGEVERQLIDLRTRVEVLSRQIKNNVGFFSKEGPDGNTGIVTLVAGVAQVTSNRITPYTRIFLTANEIGGVPGSVYVLERTPGKGFKIQSTDAGDTRDVMWLIVEPI